MRDFPTIAAIVKEAKQVPSNVPDGGAQKRNHFYCLQAMENSDEDVHTL